MKAAVIESVGRAVVTEVPDPTPGPREVVVEVAACGLCGTDLHILQGEFAPRLPIVPGHEFAGEVVGVGTRVTEVSVGDRSASRRPGARRSTRWRRWRTAYGCPSTSVRRTRRWWSRCRARCAATTCCAPASAHTS